MCCKPGQPALNAQNARKAFNADQAATAAAAASPIVRAVVAGAAVTVYLAGFVFSIVSLQRTNENLMIFCEAFIANAALR